MKPYYQDDSVTIYHCDNADYFGLWGPNVHESVDMVLTSPPYDGLRLYGGHDWAFETVAGGLRTAIKHGGVIVWVVGDETSEGSESGTSFSQALHFKELGLNIHDTMIWNKGGFTAVASLETRYCPVFEYMFVFTKGKPATFNPIKDRANKWPGVKNHGTIRQKDGSTRPAYNNNVQGELGQRFNIWEIPNPGVAGTEHPATFPIRLAIDHVVSWSNPGDTILDPFMGSGTTLRAAKDLGRKAIGIEIEERYCEIAARRMEQSVINFPPHEKQGTSLQSGVLEGMEG